MQNSPRCSESLPAEEWEQPPRSAAAIALGFQQLTRPAWRGIWASQHLHWNFWQQMFLQKVQWESRTSAKQDCPSWVVVRCAKYDIQGPCRQAQKAIAGIPQEWCKVWTLVSRCFSASTAVPARAREWVSGTGIAGAKPYLRDRRRHSGRSAGNHIIQDQTVWSKKPIDTNNVLEVDVSYLPAFAGCQYARQTACTAT